MCTDTTWRNDRINIYQLQTLIIRDRIAYEDPSKSKSNRDKTAVIKPPATKKDDVMKKKEAHGKKKKNKGNKNYEQIMK